MTATYLIAGAHGGTGATLSDILENEGYNLILTARDQGALPQTPQRQPLELDVTNENDIQTKLQNLDLEDGLHGFAYCIGSIDLKPFGKATDDDYLECYNLNVLGAIRMLRFLEPALKKANGSVVLFSTVAVQQGFSNHAVISSAKGAIEGLTRTLAAEWAPKVRVNAIAPSLTDTGIAKSLTSSEQMVKGIAAMHPMARIGTPEDLASLAAFLLSEKSGWITGQILHVDGGRSSLRTKG